MTRWFSPITVLALAALASSCGQSGSDAAGGAAGTGGLGGSAGTGGSRLGIDDPSANFDIFDPQEDEEGMDLPAGSETALPPDGAVRAFFTAIERSGGDASLLYDHSRDGQVLNVRVRVPAGAIVSDPSGGSYADIDIGAVTVRVATTVDATTTTTLPSLVVPAADLGSLVLVKSYTRSSQAGVLGPPSLDFISAFEVANEQAGPVGSLDLTEEPQVDMEEDCDSKAWELADEVPAMAVNFPPLSGCSDEECAIVKASWIRANHDVMRIRQMLEFLDTKAEAQREFLWDQPAADPEGKAMFSNTSLGYYFGDFAQYRFEAIRWVFNRLWDDMHDHNLEGLALDFECRPGGAGDVCNTFAPPAHHAVKSNVKLCDGFFEQKDSYQALLMVHEPLHHVFVPWNDNGPRLDPLKDTHTHAHGNLCIASPQTNKAYGLDEIEHLATYEANDGGHCFHRNYAFRNNDTYAWAAAQIGLLVRTGAIHHWPFIPNTPAPTPDPCSGDELPDPGDGWDDPLDQCMKLGLELVCPGGGGAALPDLDIGITCP